MDEFNISHMSSDEYMTAYNDNLPIAEEFLEMTLEAIPDMSATSDDRRKARTRAAFDANEMPDATYLLSDGYMRMFLHESTKLWTVRDKLHGLYCAVFRPFRNIPYDDDCPYPPNDRDDDGNEVFTIPGGGGFESFAGGMSPHRALTLIAAVSTIIRLLIREGLLIPPTNVDGRSVAPNTESWMAFIKAAFTIEMASVEADPSPAASPEASPERSDLPELPKHVDVASAAVHDVRIQQRLTSLKSGLRRTVIDLEALEKRVATVEVSAQPVDEARIEHGSEIFEQLLVFFSRKKESRK